MTDEQVENPVKRSRIETDMQTNDEEREEVDEAELSGEDSEVEEGTQEEGDAGTKLSKKQLRRLQKKEQFALLKKQKKQQKKDAKQALRQQNGMPAVPPPVDNSEEAVLARAEKKKAREQAYIDTCAENFHMLIDCDWESEHTDSVLSSLTQQIMFCYGINKRSPKPCFMHICNLGKRTKANLEKVLFSNWLGVTHSPEDYLEDERFCITPTAGKKQLVYLTSDAEETLDTLDPSHAYIIGGIVDRNRLKGATYNKAMLQGVRTAKLPIKENVSLSATPVLTINHVYDILLKYSDLHNWAEAIEAVLPKRKEVVVKKADATSEGNDDASVDNHDADTSETNN